MRTPLNRDLMPLVVGAPRSGFTLLISLLHSLVTLSPAFPSKGGLRQQFLDKITAGFDRYVAEAVAGIFADRGLTQDLVFSDAFRIMTGGPKWLHPDDPSRACIRKYVGVRGMGDFTLIVAYPREVLDRDPVLHFHEHPKAWPEDARYDAYPKFASVRNPIGILNSSCFSINALTSDYIQRFIPPEDDNDQLRQDLAEYKLTDLAFFQGLIRFLLKYFEEFMAVRDRYHVMRWEDLIERPVPTIQAVGRGLQLEVSEATAARIWTSLDHLNLTGSHKHNFRRGKGKVGDWRNTLVNEHLAAVREAGFGPILAELGYGPIGGLDEADYTPYQRRVAEHLRRGEPLDRVTDRDLFGFAFNKSNLASESFAFRRPGWRTHTAIERSCFADEGLEEAAWQAAEAAAARLNRVLDAVLALRFRDRTECFGNLDTLRASFGTEDDPAFVRCLEAGLAGAGRLLDWYFRAEPVHAP